MQNRLATVREQQGALQGQVAELRAAVEVEKTSRQESVSDDRAVWIYDGTDINHILGRADRTTGKTFCVEERVCSAGDRARCIRRMRSREDGREETQRPI